MKRITSLVLCLIVLALTLCGCATSGKSDSKDDALTAEKIVDMYMDNKAVWEYTPLAEGSDEWHGYLFLDFDFDGVLELVVTSTAGSGIYSSNKFYKLDTESKTVSEISFPDKDEENQWDFTGVDYPKLYRNNETDRLKYVVYDYTRAGGFAFGIRIGELFQNSDGQLQEKGLWGFTYTSPDSEFYTEGQDEYSYQVFNEQGVPSEVDSDTYTKAVEDYELYNTPLELTFKVVENSTESSTFDELPASAQADLLLDSYNAFSYK